MTRYLYGASGAAQVVGITGTPMTSPATVKNTRTLGSTVTDIQNLAGLGLGGVVTPDMYGQVIFYGPDGYNDTLWLDFGSGPRWGVNPISANDQWTARYGDVNTAEKASPDGYTPKAALPYMNDQIGEDQMGLLDNMVTPKYANTSARSAANPTPADGDRAYMTDSHAQMQYRSDLTKWISPGPQLISSYTFPNSTTNGVTFTSIPQIFNHLYVVYSGRCSNIGVGTATHFMPVRMTFHGDITSGNYVFNVLAHRYKFVASGSVLTYNVDDTGAGGTTSGSNTMTYGDINTYTGGTSPGSTIGYVPGPSSHVDSNGGGAVRVYDYTNQSFKSWSGECGWTSGTTTNYMVNGRCSGAFHGNNNAISTMSIYLINNALFTIGSKVSLYGMM